MTTCILKAEKQCMKLNSGTIAWSPQLNQLSLEWLNWKFSWEKKCDTKPDQINSFKSSKSSTGNPGMILSEEEIWEKYLSAKDSWKAFANKDEEQFRKPHLEDLASVMEITGEFSSKLKACAVTPNSWWFICPSFSFLMWKIIYEKKQQPDYGLTSMTSRTTGRKQAKTHLAPTKRCT